MCNSLPSKVIVLVKQLLYQTEFYENDLCLFVEY